MDDLDYRNGYEAGKRWAAGTASVAELQQLARTRAAAGTDWDRTFDDDAVEAYSPAERLYHFGIAGQAGDWDRAESAEFWGATVGDEHPVGTFAKGFAEGALDRDI